MRGLAIRTIVLLGANAIGLVAAAATLDDVHLDATAFVIALVLFTAVLVVVQPLLASILRRRQSHALGVVSLIATLIALVVTDLVSRGLEIDGVGTWIGATVMVWAASLIATFMLPFFGLRANRDRDQHGRRD